MRELPKSTIERRELNLRQGIKSSLSNIRSIVALVYILYRSNGRKAMVEYSESADSGQIILHSMLEEKIKTFLEIDDISIVNTNPLFRSQMEALQVGVELIFKLGKVEFLDNSLVSSAERTRGIRYNKRIRFGTNIQIIDIFFSNYEAELPVFLTKWLQNQESDKKEIDEGVEKLLTIFSEETQFKIRYYDQEVSFQQEGIYKEFVEGNTVIARDTHENVGPFRVFKSYVKEGLHPYIADNGDEFVAKKATDEAAEYYQLVSNSLDLIPKRTQLTTFEPLDVVSDDEAISSGDRDVKCSQIIFYGSPGSGKSHKVKEKTKTFNKEGFSGLSSIERQQAYQRYLDGKHGHKSNYKGGKTNMDALTHSKLIGYISSCTEFQINSLFDVTNKTDFDSIMAALSEYEPYQNDPITKGSGCHWKTGLESYGEFLVQQAQNTQKYEDAVFRTTFHPDTDYASFVGCYKPTMNENSIVYSYTPQVFTNAYIAAWENTRKPVYLVIEEINRGNCAQIFGDLFQLLDRDKITGKSEYPIKADRDLVAYIEKMLGGDHEGIRNGMLCLPPNLMIYATMNTSDQSLFPMDSAFKRRWDWEYVPINYDKNIESGEFIISIGKTEYLWVDFLKIVNDRIYDVTKSEDKQMGNFFIKNSIDAKEFVNKVMFYLWNEVCKEEFGTQRNFFRNGKDGKIEFKFTDLFGADQNTILNEFMMGLGVMPINVSETTIE